MSKYSFKLKEKIYSNVVLDAFYSYSKRCEHHRALNTHAVYVSFILEARGRSRTESPKRTHREVIVTFYSHPAIAVAKLNNKHKT